jgi:5-methylcytosine-specific restriction protein A
MTDLHPWKHEPRKRLTDQQRAKLFLDKGGKCHKCGRKLRSGDTWVAEHMVALSVGGDNSPENWDVTCEWCFPEKNREDASKAAKGRAVATSCIIPRSQRQKKGRPMMGSRASGWRKRMDGTVERR